MRPPEPDRKSAPDEAAFAAHREFRQPSLFDSSGRDGAARVARDDEPFPITQAARRFPALRHLGRGGQPASPGQVTRWIAEGITAGGSRVKLDAIKGPAGQWLITARDVRSFLSKLNAADAARRRPQSTEATAAQKAHQRAELELNAFGL